MDEEKRGRPTKRKRKELIIKAGTRKEEEETRQLLDSGVRHKTIQSHGKKKFHVDVELAHTVNDALQS